MREAIEDAIPAGIEDAEDAAFMRRFECTDRECAVCRIEGRP